LFDIRFGVIYHGPLKEAGMEKRSFGRTGMQVTVLGHGAMEIRGPRVWSGRPVTDAEAQRILNAVLDAGINFIDTSWDYGLSEEYIGKFISHRRGEYVLATKCGCTFVNKGDHDDTPHVWTRENLLQNIETSLRRMNTDHVDLWQLHNPSVEETRTGDLVAVLQEVKKSGKALHIGISSTLPHILDYIEWGVFESFQIPYSGLERKHEAVISKAAQSGAGVIVRGGVARGEPGAGLGTVDRWELFDKAKLGELLGPGETRTGFMLRFTISHPGMHTTIVGTKNPDHLANNVRAIQAGKLPPDVYEEAKRRLSQAGESPAPAVKPAAEPAPKPAPAPTVPPKPKVEAPKPVQPKPAPAKPAVAKKPAAKPKAPAKAKAPARKPAAKKAAKKAPEKAAKKVAKKPARKAAKKPAKKGAPKKGAAKKAAKKPARKGAKKVARKAAKRPTRKVARKPARKAAKKPAKKAAKKPAKKAAKKTAPKRKPAKKAAKKRK
jgi:aryl-alcohol dehydrogenase-like predicted oxidoreductase